MTTAIDAVNEMVELQPSRRPTAKYAATTSVATPYEPRDARWNVLIRALQRRTIDRSDVLGIARGTLDRRDLELRAPRGLGCRGVVEYGVAQRGDEPVIGQMAAMFVVEHCVDLAQERERLGRQLKPDDVYAHLGVRWVLGAVAAPMVGDKLLDLAQILAGRGLAPRRLGRGRRDTRQLAHGRERELAVRECCRELRQGTECARHPRSRSCATRGP